MPYQPLQQVMFRSAKSIPKQTLENDILMRSIKILDIGYLTIVYVILAIICAKITDAVFGEFDEEQQNKRSMAVLSLEMILSLWIYGVLIYAIRNIVPLIPFPLNGVQGFDHMRVKEVTNPTIFTIVFLTYCAHLKSKISYYYKRLPSTQKKKSKKEKETETEAETETDEVNQEHFLTR